MSPRHPQSVFRAVATALVAGLMAACGGGGGGGDSSFSPPAPPPPPPPAGPMVTISGTVTYDYVPHRPLGAPNPGGLDYDGVQARPVRFATVQFVEGTIPLATTTTDLNGDYSLSVPENRTGLVRVSSTSTRSGSPGWNFRVVDNTNGNTPYALEGAPLSSGTANSMRDLHAPSGWTGTGYGAQRAAAPFAILDTIYTGAAYVLAANPATVFPSLDIHWSVNNVATTDENGDRNPLTGEIETSYYSAGTMNGIYLLGEENQDTDEYDAHIVLHEFGHYLEHRLGRSENFGGPHRGGDRLDPRVAFSEGWPTAFAALALGDPMYFDASFFVQQFGSGFNIEQPLPGFANSAPGWFSEQSVWELVYDLVDAAVDGSDTLAYPFADVWSVITVAIPVSNALPTIFPFWSAIKAAHPGDVAVLDQLTTDQLISPIMDHYGTGETNSSTASNPAYILPIYTPITFGVPVNLCSINEFGMGLSGAVNKLGSRRFLTFSSAIQSSVTVRVTATSIPAGEYADPDFILHRGRFIAVPPGEGPPSLTCQDNAVGSGVPSSCSETMSYTTPPDDYVLEIYEWTNTNDSDDPDFPPIGTTCFDVLVTQP